MHSEEPRLILFDIDQTLVYTAGAGMRALTRAVLEVLDLDLSRVGVMPAGKTDPQILREAVEHTGRPAPDPATEAAVWDSYARHLDEEMARTDPRREVKPGVRPLVETLHAMPGFCLGLLTGNLQRTARIKLEPFHLNAYFPVGGFGSDHADRGRLGAVAVERAQAHYGISFPPHRVWIVGDTDRDIGAARSLHPEARALAVATGHQSVEELRRFRPDAAVEDLSDTGAVLRILASKGSPGAGAEAGLGMEAGPGTETGLGMEAGPGKAG